MPLLAAAAGAAGTALGLVALGRAAGRTADERQAEDAAEAAASRSACVKRLGVATCLRAGSWVKASRHVALVGGALVIGRRPGAAERSLQLRGANIAADGYVVKVTALSGATLATFWLNSPVEAARWADELDSCATTLSNMSSLPKASSLKRRKLQMDAISAEQDLWEAKIRMAQDSRAQQDTLLVEVAETAQEETKLNSDIERKTDLPKRLSPNRRQAEKLEQICKDKEGQVAVLQGQLDACPGSPGELGLDGAPAAAERAQQRRRAPPDQGEAADPPRRRPWAPPERPAVGGAAERAAAPAAGRGGTADGAGGRDWAVRFLELPWVRAARGAPEGAPRERRRRAAAPAAGRGGAADGAGDCDWAVRLLQLPWAQAARGAQVAEKSVDQDARIAELEWRLARSAQELLKGPAVVKEMFAETFGTTPEDQGKLGPWSPRGCLCTPRAAMGA